LIFSYSLTALALTTLLLIVLGFVSLFWLVVSKGKSFKFLFFYNLLFGIVFGLVHAWWLSQLLFINSSANFNESVSSFFSTEGNIGGLTDISRKLGSTEGVTAATEGTHKFTAWKTFQTIDSDATWHPMILSKLDVEYFNKFFQGNV
jgi:hypothetical protein